MQYPTLRLFDGFEHTSNELQDEVKILQKELNQEKFGLEEDGLFGYATELAVKQFQREHGLDDDGIVGPLTWAALLREIPPVLEKHFATSYSKNNPSLTKQLTEAEKYRSIIENASAKHGFSPSLIGGIGSRESHWGLILRPPDPSGTGDFARRRYPTRFRNNALPQEGGFGRGLMQIDFDAHEFARTGNWKDPEENIEYGCRVLAESREFIRRKTNLEGTDLLRGALAGYNGGPGNALRAIRDGRDFDYYTTGRDYSRDVLNRAGFFQLHDWG